MVKKLKRKVLKIRNQVEMERNKKRKKKQMN